MLKITFSLKIIRKIFCGYIFLIYLCKRNTTVIINPPGDRHKNLRL